MSYLSETADRLATLADELNRADTYPVKRTERTLELTGELSRLIDELRDRAIVAALSERKLSIREVSRLVGLSTAQVHKRGKDHHVNTSVQPLDSMQWRPSA